MRREEETEGTDNEGGMRGTPEEYGGKEKKSRERGTEEWERKGT